MWGLPFYWSRGVESSTKYSLQRHFQVLIGYSLALFLEEPNLWNATDAFQKSRTQPSDEDQQGGSAGITHLLLQSETEEPRRSSEGALGFHVTCRGCAGTADVGCVPGHVWANGCPADAWSLQTCVWVSEAHVLKKHAWMVNPAGLSKSSN